MSAIAKDGLKTDLLPYQVRGAIFAACRGRVVLADDMGLGKTVQALAATEMLRRHRGISKVLVIAPASVKYQWKKEIEKFTGLSAQGSTSVARQTTRPSIYHSYERGSSPPAPAGRRPTEGHNRAGNPTSRLYPNIR